MRVAYVCRACYAPTPPGIKPWQAFICACYQIDPHSRKGRAIAKAKKEARRKERHGDSDD